MKLRNLTLLFLSGFLFYNPIIAQHSNQEPKIKSLKEKTSKALKAYIDIKKINNLKNENFAVAHGFSNVNVTTKESGTFPSFGYAYFNKKGHYREFSISLMGVRLREISELQYFKDSSNTVTIFPSAYSHKEALAHVGVRWEYAFPILEKNKNHFYLGASVEPTLYFQDIQPLSAAYFPRKTVEIKNNLTLSPRYIWDITKNLYMDFNIPISIISLNYTYRYWANPVLPTYARRQGNWRTQFFKDNLQARIGLGFKI